MKEGSIPEDWKSSVVLPIYKGKDDPRECGSYTGIKLLEHAMKVVQMTMKISLMMKNSQQQQLRLGEVTVIYVCFAEFFVSSLLVIIDGLFLKEFTEVF